jgi:hypothetical protein
MRLGSCLATEIIDMMCKYLKDIEISAMRFPFEPLAGNYFLKPRAVQVML